MGNLCGSRPAAEPAPAQNNKEAEAKGEPNNKDAGVELQNTKEKDNKAEDDKRKRAAVRIQSKYRGHRQRRLFLLEQEKLRKLKAAVRIQSLFRMHRERRRYKRAIHCVVLFQARYRGYIARQKQKKYARRVKIAGELLSTERTYVSHLDTLVEQYVLPLRTAAASKKAIVNEASVKIMFNGVEVIRGLNKALLADLEAKMVDFTPQQTLLGPVFLTMTQFLRSGYAAYVRTFKAAMDEEGLQSKSNKAYKKFSMEARAKPPGLNCQSLLITPVQRIPRYILLLQDLLKNTPWLHPDRVALDTSLKQMMEAAQVVNSAEKANSDINKVVMISTTLRGFDDHDLVQPHRAFVRESDMKFLVAGVIPVTMRVILFNDFLLVAKKDEKKNEFEFTKGWALAEIDVAGAGCDITVTLPSVRKIDAVFTTQTPAEANDWLNAIRVETEKAAVDARLELQADDDVPMSPRASRAPDEARV